MESTEKPKKETKKVCQRGGIKPRSGYATVLGSEFGERYVQDCMWNLHGDARSYTLRHRRYPINKRARVRSFYAMSEIPSSQKVLCRSIRDRYVLNVCYPMCNDRIGNSPVGSLIENE